ncbi:hypothetical protein OPIT5_29455 [Opitutaceae bacterium TAV5]|nr:hypothetical protein OPIT5_29455 [Opitutaceae bacterium TAV5]
MTPEQFEKPSTEARKSPAPVPTGLAEANADVLRICRAEGREAAIRHTVRLWGGSEADAAELVDKLLACAARPPASPAKPAPAAGGMIAVLLELFAAFQCIAAAIGIARGITSEDGVMLWWSACLIPSALAFVAFATVVRLLLRIEANTRKAP